MKHKGPAVWLQQWGQHQSVLFLPISLRGEVVVWPIMTFMKAPLRRTYEDLWWCWPCRPHKCCRCGAFHCRCGIQFWALKEKWVWSGAILLFCFRPGTSRERRTGLSVSPEQTVWDGGHAVLLWNFEEGDWVPFRKPSGMCMGKPVWATGISSKRSTARVQWLHHGREEPVFVIRNAMEKVCIVHSLTHICSSGPVIHLQGLRLTDPF